MSEVSQLSASVKLQYFEALCNKFRIILRLTLDDYLPSELGVFQDFLWGKYDIQRLAQAFFQNESHDWQEEMERTMKNLSAKTRDTHTGAVGAFRVATVGSIYAFTLAGLIELETDEFEEAVEDEGVEDYYANVCHCLAVLKQEIELR